ncbi:hypothetical protein TL16_g04778 [Triparma laevis f. inornata]|uniref:Uncharacterized protein n=2 Tax=Triparma laevis TaxID=1534972 RepID=A0A9W7FJB2_9STRA|nr:hypothetical protein TL16_g04778 [Triparma laevis f. inornata]GMI13524.1 hypothetical protein TrLO_g6781 [Triparma laevis f. longispina]
MITAVLFLCFMSFSDAFLIHKNKARHAAALRLTLDEYLTGPDATDALTPADALSPVKDAIEGSSDTPLSNLPKIETPDLPFEAPDLPKFDMPDLPKFDMPKFDSAPDLPKFDLPLNLPSLPKFDALPKFDTSELNIDTSQIPSLPPAVLDTLKPLITWSSTVPHLFEVATFAPQIFWLLIIIPGLSESEFTKFIMKPLTVPVVLSLVHLSIVYLSIIDPSSGTAPIAEFNGVFDLSGDPQAALVGMMKYPNFVSEEWSHVLTWDLFVGRWIWLDGMKRGVFTPVSLLFCNLIGPPGLLLHILTGIVQGKGLPKDFE